MDQLEPEEGTNSITESSQEWHILNLLRVCERDLFESNLQEFRKIQLTESQDGKIRLCKLINEILRLDPQYSIILVEDLSHLFNDSNFLVQKFSLISLVDCFNILFSHIIASNEALETVRLTGTLDSLSKSQITRCKHATSINNGYPNNTQGPNHYNTSIRSSSGLNGVPNSVKGNEEEAQEEENLPFSLDNIRVTESFADFACIRFMVHTRLLECDFSDVKYSSPHFLPTLIHNRTKFYSVNLLKMLFYELANYPNYLCNQCISESETSEGLETNKVKSKKKKVKGVKTEETNLDIYETLYKWHSESVNLLKILIARHNKYSGMDGNKKVKKESDGLVESVLSCEVACSLIGFYPEYYFEEFVDVLVSLLRTQSHTVFEHILFRIFSFNNCYRYHHLLLDKVNEKGYGLDLETMYKLVQTLPSVSCEAYRGTMMAVDNSEAPNKETNYDLSDKLVTSLSVEVDEKLNLYPAAQIFEFDKELVKNYKSSKFKNSQINISNNFYKRKPVNITPISYEHVHTDEPVEEGNDKVRVESDKLEKKLEIVEDSVIKKNEKLFVRLVGNQMIDTVSSYQRFLKFEVIGPKVVNFDRFASLVLKHFLVSNLIKFENRKEVLRNLLDYLAEHTLINHAESHILKSLKHHSGCYGLSLLFNCVNKQNSVQLFNKFLEELNRHIIFSYTTNFAKSTSTTDQSRQLKYMDEYETFVNLCLSYVCEKLSESEEVSDISVNALSKFVLSLPKIPDKMSDLILVWVNSENQGNLKLAFSLVSNLLKHSSLVKRADFEKLLGKDNFRYISNMLLVKRSVFAIFLTCITSKRKQVSSLFLRLLSSQKGLYNVKYNYTIKSFESVHEEFVTKLKEFNGSEDEKDLVEDCLYLSDRPFWQWPKKLVVLATQLLNFNLSHVLDCYEDVDESVVDEGFDDGDEDIGVWIEESVGLMCNRNSLKTSKFIKDAVESLFNNESQDNTIDQATDDKLDRADKDELDFDKSDKDEFEVIMEDVAERKVSEDDLVYFEPMLSCCIKNSRLVFRLCSLANSYPGTHFYTKCSLTLSNYQKELQLIIKYNEEYMSLVESVLEEMRKNWCNVMFKFDERTSLEKNLMKLLMEKMSVTPEYVIQMSPFLTPEQLNKLLTFLFRKYEKDKIVKVLDVIIETPKVSLPQHFLYSIYNMPTTQTSTLGTGGVSEGSTVDEKDYMKLQVLLLDTCIKYCTMGRFSVESAISSLYLIVESFDNINFVFGRLLCQFVQKVPLTRKVIVDVIFPKLIQKQCWQDKQLFKGVVITICTLWNHFKDHLLRYILEMPNSNVKTILKALQAQYNISDYFKNITLPDNVQTILQDVINNK
ncbi:uncharacterized protein TA08230 [Theileria annulata]|uniref:Symplekin C-terminal domain-containing protein n=1 Tax=Theileria annulata TaxID=5874 RepID=Q4U9R5_THEAN|nr:uncharacterized protein TA08230 [Theileria annulata]CAI76438.1 hypothetical protein TA08230 [Theileria annulata]|eukprot:XP_953063.1 hypothetical protein TA08230 [Theileria annulata]